jgi:Uma2 family endonuclease
MIATPTAADFVTYPDSDGKPMAENTVQYRWIVTLQGNIDAMYRDHPDVFVAGDNLIYPVRGIPTICTAPDVYVAFGRPKGDRGSYKVWEEGGVFPQVVFEVLSPNNTHQEMREKRQFYRRHGAEEYYEFDPDTGVIEGWTRDGRRFVDVDDMNGWVSPRLGVRFDTSGDELVLYRPDGARFLTFDELDQLAASERQRADAEAERANAEARRAELERLRAIAEQQRAEAATTRAEAEQQRAEAATTRAEAAEAKAARLLAKLRAAGLDPNGE